jgi:hypothetical protein
MPLAIDDARRAVADILAKEYPGLRLVGVSGQGGTAYTEVFVSVADCHAEPCRLAIGVQRDTSEAGFRDAFRDMMRRHITVSQTSR